MGLVKYSLQLQGEKLAAIPIRTAALKTVLHIVLQAKEPLRKKRFETIAARTQA